jgi:hypothetical protein
MMAVSVVVLRGVDVVNVTRIIPRTISMILCHLHITARTIINQRTEWRPRQRPAALETPWGARFQECVLLTSRRPDECRL